MYDIYFDLNNMHQTVDMEEKDDGSIDLSKLYDELNSVGDEQLVFDFNWELDLPDDRAVIVHKPCVCKDCGDIFPQAEPNQKDGSFKCWSCRNY